MGDYFKKIGGWRGVVGFVLAALIAGTSVRTMLRERRATEAESELRTGLEAMANEGPVKAMYAEVRRSYPEDWNAFVTLMIDGYRTDPNPESGRKLGFEWARKFMRARLGEAIVAPTPDLVRAMTAESALLGVLKSENPAACAELVWTGQIEPADSASFSAAATSRLAEFQGALIAAAAAGKRQPTPHRAVTMVERAAMEQGLRKIGASADTLKLLASPDAAAQAADRTCPAGVDMITALTRVEPELQATFIAAMLKDAVKAGAPAS